MNQEKIWNYFQNEGVDSFSQSLERMEFLLNSITQGMRVLNIGVGNGTLERLALAKNIDISCLDPSERAIDSIRSSLGIGEKAQVGFSQSLPFPNQQFDVVIMSEVLEHLSDEVFAQTLIECRRVLCDGGRFIGTVPADEILFENNVVCPDCGKLFHRWGHVQEFSKQRLKVRLQTQFDHCVITRQYFGSWQHLNWKGRVRYCLKTLAVSLGIKGGSESFFFIARK
jgi:SAM-dependent methyltransferase